MSTKCATATFLYSFDSLNFTIFPCLLYIPIMSNSSSLDYLSLQATRDLRAVLEVGLSMSSGQVSGSRNMDLKTRALLEEIALAEDDVARLKQKVAELHQQLNQQREHHYGSLSDASHQFQHVHNHNPPQYLAELLAERQKLAPFMQVMPICSRLLNQEQVFLLIWKKESLTTSKFLLQLQQMFQHLKSL